MSRTTRCAALVVLSTVFLASLMSVPVRAATRYDGTYDYRYNIYEGSSRGWVTYKVSSGFIVKDGRISSDPPALSGWVDSNGNVRFTGPCPYGGSTAVFTGTISSDGTGKGTYQCSYGHRGAWAVTLVSRPGPLSFLGGVFETMDFYTIVTVGVGTAAVLGVSIAIARAISARLYRKQPSGQEKEAQLTAQASKPTPPVVSHETPPTTIGAPYQALQPAPSSTSHEIPASPIGVPPPSASPEAGIGPGPVPLPSELSLGVNWSPGQVDLFWDSPSFDASLYQLDGYEISMLRYEPTSTMPVKRLVAQLPPGSQQWTGPYNQTYRYSTRGDIEGYVVEAVLRHTSSTGHVHTYRVGAVAHTPYPPSP